MAPNHAARVAGAMAALLSTMAVVLRLGLIPNSTGSFTFRMDDLAITRCP